VTEHPYPTLGSTARLLVCTLLAALLLAIATIALFPGWPEIVRMALPTELALTGAIAWGLRRSGSNWRSALGFRPLSPRVLPPLALILIGAVTVFSEMYVIVQRIVPVPPEFEALLRDLLKISDRTDLLFTVAAAVALAPLLEEALFRGLILHGLARWKGPRAATVWTAAFFAFFHFYNPWQIVPTFFLGLLLGWVVLTTRSLWASIVLHSAFNGLSLIVFAFPVEAPDAPPALVVTAVVALLLLGSGALLGGMAWLEGMTGGGEFADDPATDHAADDPQASEAVAPGVRSERLGGPPVARG